MCAAPGVELLRRRFGPDASIESVPYGERRRIGDVTVSFHPAGHILGSAQVRVEDQTGVWVLSGDYKRAPDPTCAPFEPVRCDTFVTESTFGLPVYRWDPTPQVISEIMEWWDTSRADGRTAVLFCYTLGKAQRLLAELAMRTDRAVLAHGMMLGMIHVYREAGIQMLPTPAVLERRRGTSLAGELVLAPLSARGTPWMRRLGELSDGFVSGTMRVRGVRRQRAFDRGFVLSDHADWPALLETVRDTGASRVLVSHGHAAPLARFLADAGLEAGVIRTAWEGEADSMADTPEPGGTP
jgi:putative mRNA 3-end processing factor